MKILFAVFLSLCLIFTSPFTLCANSVDTDYIEYDLIEYDYINKTEKLISSDEIYDYSALTSTTYELSNMVSSFEENSFEGASTFDIINPNESFNRTSPTDSNGNPVDPYSGVVYLMIGVDVDFDGEEDIYVEDYNRGSGFLVAPDVVVTAAHCIFVENYELVSIRVYPFHHRALPPSATYSTNYVYPSRWVYSTGYSSNWQTDTDTASKHDWCVMKLQEDIVGAYNFSCTYNSVQLNDAVSLSGYPFCDLVACGNDGCPHNKGYQVTSTGNISGMDTYRVMYTNNSRSAQSGGPVYDTNTKVCIAIHTNGGNSYNQGVLISNYIYNVISEYIQME